MNNIQFISDAYMCSNCGACNAICPKGAISFDYSSMGRMTAVVDSESCIDCGLCRKACPSVDYYHLSNSIEDRFLGNISNVYAGKSLDNKIFENSQSGGVTTQLLCYLFDKHMIDCALVVRMTTGSVPKVSPVIIKDKNELFHTQKSCYTPVDLLSALKETRGYRSVAIVGIPCHVAGIINLQKTSNQFGNITYKLGLICDRTLCAGIMDVFKEHLHSISSDSTDFKIDWRCKKIGNNFCYKDAPVALHNQRGETYIAPREMRLSLKEMFTSPRCRVCFDKLNTHADITVGDPWGMTDIDWEKGETAIISRTSIGQELLENAKNDGYISLQEHDTSEIVNGQGINHRRVSTRLFANALNSLVKTDGIGYLEQQVSDESDYKQQAEILKSFIGTESNNTSKQITAIAFNELKKQEKRKKLVYRIAHRVKRLLKR
ncbi:MAG: Coenzyme F420 hydrogenase/dehydrogenase, beta subunit C-terminal domain [Muribaculaceae bacterium]|nr:Coenzyme F420 hydrogenase/dehydrogenase, beta subunit C-terminal domain [Muribaculaceae bacterium]